MSDYTSTFTESTGDTIDTTDFSTEFNAIETAIATKLDTASDTATDLTFTSSSATINGKPAYGMVILDTPEELINVSAQVAALTQYDMSAGGTEAAAAATAGATKAILRLIATSTSSGTNGYIQIAVQKNGLGGSPPARLYALAGSSGNQTADTCDVIINLDSNSDFEYKIPYNNATGSAQIYLAGYFV